MRRHGWALCLGALLAGSAAAQPPAGDERFPPAPDLPGQVVGQLIVPLVPNPDVGKDAKPAAAPLPDAVLDTSTTTVTAPVIAVGPGAMAVPGGPAVWPAPACPTPAKSGCNIGFWEVADWLCFRSRSRQSAHFVTPYRPPLQAWFPCEPRKAPCGTGCAGCPTGPAMPGAIVPGPASLLPLPAPTPVGPHSPEPPLAGGMAIGKCLDAEVLTTFQPVAPGLGFAPGGAPMANPTTQVKPTSFKPK